MINTTKKPTVKLITGMVTSFVILAFFSLIIKQQVKNQQKEKYNSLKGSITVGEAQEQDRKNHPMFYFLNEKNKYFEVARFDARGNDQKDLTTILLLGDQKKAKQAFYTFLDTQNIDPSTQEFEFFEKDMYIEKLYQADSLARFLPIINNRDYEIYYNRNSNGTVVIYVTLYTEPYSKTKKEVTELFKANNDDIGKYTVKWQNQSGTPIEL